MALPELFNSGRDIPLDYLLALFDLNSVAPKTSQRVILNGDGILKLPLADNSPAMLLALRNAFRDDLDALDLMLDRSILIIHGYIRNFLTLRGQRTDEAIKMLRVMFRSARLAISDDAGLLPAQQIPRLLHRIWLTSPEAPCEPPTHYIDNMLSEAVEYRRSGWTHRLWVQDPNHIPKTMARLAQEGSVIQVATVDFGLSGGGWRVPFKKLLKDRKFPFAADILRMHILYEYGGVYADMGAAFRRTDAANFVVDRFDYALIFWETMFFQNSLMAMPAGSAVGSAFLRLVDRPDTIPPTLIGPLDGVTEGMVWSGLMITAILMASEDPSTRICPLAPNGELVRWASEKSWYTDCGHGSGKFGNAYVPGTGASVLSGGVMGSGELDVMFTPQVSRRSQI